MDSELDADQHGAPQQSQQAEYDQAHLEYNFW